MPSLARSVPKPLSIFAADLRKRKRKWKSKKEKAKHIKKTKEEEKEKEKGREEKQKEKEKEKEKKEKEEKEKENKGKRKNEKEKETNSEKDVTPTFVCSPHLRSPRRETACIDGGTGHYGQKTHVFLEYLRNSQYFLLIFLRPLRRGRKQFSVKN